MNIEARVVACAFFVIPLPRQRGPGFKVVDLAEVLHGPLPQFIEQLVLTVVKRVRILLLGDKVAEGRVVQHFLSVFHFGTLLKVQGKEFLSDIFMFLSLVIGCFVYIWVDVFLG